MLCALSVSSMFPPCVPFFLFIRPHILARYADLYFLSSAPGFNVGLRGLPLIKLKSLFIIFYSTNLTATMNPDRVLNALDAEMEHEYVERMLEDLEDEMVEDFPADVRREKKRYYEEAYCAYMDWGRYTVVGDFTERIFGAWLNLRDSIRTRRDRADFCARMVEFEEAVGSRSHVAASWQAEADAASAEVDELIRQMRRVEDPLGLWDDMDREVVETADEEDSSDEYVQMEQLKLPQDLPLCDECDECSICLESNPMLPRMITPCGHVFHKACLFPLTEVRRSAKTSRVWDAPLFLAFENTENCPPPDVPLFNFTCEVPCPLCRALFVLDNGTGAEEFAKWSACTCCARHMVDRPPSYAFWETPNSCVSQSYSMPECRCYCRRRMRELVRLLPAALQSGAKE